MYESKKPPMCRRKPDTTKNENDSTLAAVMEKQREREKSLRAIRISRNTCIAVPPEKANRAYAEQYKKDHI